MKKMSKKITQLVLVICVIASFILVSGIVFITQAKNGLYEEKINYLKEISMKSAESLHQQITGNLSTLDAIATFIGSHENFDPMHSLPILKKENDHNNFKRMGIILANGMGYTTDDRITDLSNREYFKDAMRGESTVSNCIVDIFDDSEIMVFASPIDHNEEVVGVVFAVMSRDSFAESLNIDIFNGEGYSYVISADGLPVVRSNSPNSLGVFENFYVEMEKVGIEPSKIEQMKHDLNLLSRGVMSYSREGIDKEMCYASVKINDWFVVTIIPSEVISLQSDRLIMNLITITSLVIGITIITSFMMIRYFKNNSSRLEKIAYSDKITGYSNWDKFALDVHALMKINDRKKYCMIDFDINKFKVINDVYGHAKGNMILKQVADILYKKIVSSETFARVSADHFNILMMYETDELIIERMSEMERNISNLIHDYKIELSIGIYPITEEIYDISILSDRATVAKNIAKRSNDLSYHFFREENRNDIIKEKEIENMMEASLIHNEFEVFLQPKYSLKNEKIVGAEALVRWKKKDGSYIFPNDFIPLFERNGFIRSLDMYMFEKICVLINSWESEYHKSWDIPISVNISRVHLSSKMLPQSLVDIAKRYEVNPSLIEIELTESALLSDEVNIIEMMNHIKAGGFAISIDDFGSGYSSLSTLKDLPADVVKIDKCFLDKAIDDLRGEEIIRSIVLMTKGLGLMSIAEGVEDKKQVEFLRKVGCDMAQGYYYSKAIPVSEFMNLINK